MDGEGVSSLAVVDNQQNVVGNISTVDVKVCLGLPENMEVFDSHMIAPDEIKLCSAAR